MQQRQRAQADANGQYTVHLEYVEQLEDIACALPGRKRAVTGNRSPVAACVWNDHTVVDAESVKVEQVCEIATRASQPVKEKQRLAGASLLHVRFDVIDRDHACRGFHDSGVPGNEIQS
jgi:hypothetical protein